MLSTPRRGFTLIELLVVVLIIGILAAVAVPQYQKAVTKSQAVKGFVKMNALDQAQRAYYLANGTFTTDLNSLDIGTINEGCGSSGTVVFCKSNFSQHMFFEWQGNSSSGKTRWICGAKSSDETLNQLCTAYWNDWGRAGSPVEDTQYNVTYYYSAWK